MLHTDIQPLTIHSYWSRVCNLVKKSVVYYLCCFVYPTQKISNGALGCPKCIGVLICMYRNSLKPSFICSFGFWGPLLFSASLPLFAFGYFCAVKCLKPVLAVTQHVGNWRRWVKEGEEFIKPRTTSQFLLIYHINPHLSHSVPK